MNAASKKILIADDDSSKKIQDLGVEMTRGRR